MKSRLLKYLHAPFGVTRPSTQRQNTHYQYILEAYRITKIGLKRRIVSQMCMRCGVRQPNWAFQQISVLASITTKFG